jgi:oligopeptide transport system substrate-binding protein
VEDQTRAQHRARGDGIQGAGQEAPDQNNNFNCNRKAEEIINQAEQSDEPAKRKQLLTQATKMIMDDYPIIPLVQYSLPRLVKSYVGGYSLENAQDRFRSKDLYIIKH